MGQKLVIFDVDGTLLDTSDGIIASVEYVLEKYHLPEVSQEILESFIGPPVQDSFQRVFGVNEEQKNEMAETFRNQYKDNDLLKAVPYEGVHTLLQNLSGSGSKLAIATFKRQDYAETIVKHFGLDRYVPVICGSDFAGRLKKKDIIAEAVLKTGIKDLSQVVMIGDTELDCEGARNQGIKFIGVTYGYGYNKGERIIGDHVLGQADSLEQVYDILRSWLNDES